MNFPGWYVPIMLLETSGDLTPERTKGWSQSKDNTQLWMELVIEGTFDAVEGNIAYEHGFVRSMNKGKLEALKQELTRVNIGILEISELRWIGMGESH